MAMKMEAEMNQGAGGAMMGGEEEDDIMVDTMEQLGHRSKVPNFGFYNDFDDVLADDNNWSRDMSQKVMIRSWCLYWH